MLTSVSFAATVIVLGFVYDRTGFGLVPIAFGFAMLGVALVAGRIPDGERLHVRSGVTNRNGRRRFTGGWRIPSGGSFRLALQVQPRLGPLMIGLGLVHVGILAAFTFLPLRILDLGGEPSQIALGSGLAAAIEVPAMTVIGAVVSRIGLRALVVGGAAVYAVALVGWAGLDSIPAIIAVRAAVGVAFAAIAIGAVMAIGNLLPSRLQATGQGMFATVSFGLAAIVASSIGGIVYSAGGHAPLFLGGAVSVAAGGVVTWRALPGHREAIPVPELPDGTSTDEVGRVA